MTLGVSLRTGYLLDDPRDPASATYLTVLGERDAFFDRCRDWGIAAIEVRDGGGAATERIGSALRVIRAAGLVPTLHWALPPETGAAEAVRHLGGVVREAELPAPLVTTVHALAEARGEVRDLAARTVKVLGLLAREIANHDWPVRLVLENNRHHEAEVDPSTRLHVLEGMLDAPDCATVGLCWDFGHLWSNAECGFDLAEPPETFLRRVAHTHVHGAQGSVTHRPLDGTAMPLRDWVARLRSAGYGGVYNLELNPDRAGPAGLQEAVRAGAALLRVCLAAAS